MFKKKNLTTLGRNRPPTKSPGPGGGAAVFSYHANRSTRPETVGRRPLSEVAGQGQSPPVTAASLQKKAKTRHLLQRSVVVIGLVIGLGVIVINLPLTEPPSLRVMSDSRAGNVFLRSASVYQAAAQDILQTSRIRNSNKLTVDRHYLSAELKTRFPELATVRVSAPLIGRHLIIELQPVTPSLVLTTTRAEAFLLDTGGRALISALKVPNLEKFQLITVKDDSGLGVGLGQTVLPTSSVSFITEVAAQLRAKKLEIVGMTLPATTHQLEVKVKGTPYIVRFNLEGEARAEAGTYLAVKEYLERSNKLPSSYIDVRVDGRAFYR